MPKKSVRIFFSWQSDSPDHTNRNAIRSALRAATKYLSKLYPGLSIVLDEATRDTSGSPNIAAEILKKIRLADILVADVTTVTSPRAKRPCPNPNVVFELGYAVSEMGWDRIILLFNTGLGRFPQDLPFDFAQHRASPYKFLEGDSKDRLAPLVGLLEVALRVVVEKNPKRPAELRGLSIEEVQHRHDVKQLRRFMSHLHLPTLDEHVAQMPHRLNDKTLWFWEHVQGVVSSSLFSIYDPTLRDNIERFVTAWGTSLSHSQQYHQAPNGHIYIFGSPGDMPLIPSRQAAWDEIESACNVMSETLRLILERLREAYFEIDVMTTNKKCWTAWRQYFDENESPEAIRRLLKKPAKKKRQ